MASKRLAGKVILITGAAQGIGRASAVACGQQGAKVIATDLNMEKLQELQKEYPDIVIDHLDVTNEEQVCSVVRRFPAINTLFNCAGWVHHGRLDDTSTADWENSFKINVTSMFFLSKCLVTQWLKTKSGGNIINMASVASSMKATTNRCAYSTTKAAVIGFTKSIAMDYVEQGIRANCICPGTVDTPSLRERLGKMGGGDAQKGYEIFVSRQKMGRLATAEELASLVIYLASDESAFVTGSEFKIDGGWSL